MKKLKRVLALAMAVILSVPTLLTGTGTIPVKAADDSIELVVSNESAKYAGYETRKMSAGGNYAYCITPSKKTPAAGTYTKHYDVATYMKTPGDESAAENLRHIAYYCWGAPGFNAGNFPATWYDGSAMDDDKYIALSHIILADAASYEGGEAMHGCNSSFKNWAYQNVLGFNTAGELINENAPRFKLTWQPVPDSFKIFVLATGKTQNILGYEYTPTGTVSLSKTSANTGITSGNSCYSLAGAVYGIYSDAGCSAQVTTLTTDAGGNAAAVSLNAGTYYYKELKVNVMQKDDSEEFARLKKDGNYEMVTINRETLVDNMAFTSVSKKMREKGYFVSRIPGTYGENEKHLILPVENVFVADEGRTYVGFIPKNKPSMVAENGNVKTASYENIHKQYENVTRNMAYAKNLRPKAPNVNNSKILNPKV